MKSLLWIVLILLYSSHLLLASNKINLTQDDLNNVTLTTMLNNYFGCKTWTDGICTQCSTGYYFNHQNICCAVPTTCRVFDVNTELCKQCYPGYDVLLNGTCTVTILSNPTPVVGGCIKWAMGACIQCAYRWYLDSTKTCQQVDDYCLTWNNLGQCESCYNGYTLSNGTCYLFTQITNYCQKWQNQFCVSCVYNAYFDQNNICSPVSPFCKTWNQTYGYCLSCYQGYSLVNDGNCAISTQATTTTDVGCKRWNLTSQTCLECSTKWVKGTNGACVQVSDTCLTWDVNGFCTSCYNGYSLNNGICSLSLIIGGNDNGCKRWNWTTQTCLECSAHWVIGQNGICKEISGNCQTWDITGTCTACYNGYTLINNDCLFSTEGPIDLGCKRWNWTTKTCIECSTRWFMGAGGLCNPVSDQCATFDSITGTCLSCYRGYILQNDGCQLLNVFCRTGNPDGSCSSCYNTYVLYNQQCIPISKLANIAQYYAACCPETLAQLQTDGRIN